MPYFRRPLQSLAFLACLLQACARAADSPVSLGPTPYRSFENDSPLRALRTEGDSSGFFHLEDFEDGEDAINAPGVWTNDSEANNLGWVLSGKLARSVGNGANGRVFTRQFAPEIPLELFFNSRLLGDQLPTHVGIVVTDAPAVANRQFAFEAFNRAGERVASVRFPCAAPFASESPPGLFVGAIAASGIARVSMIVTDDAGKPAIDGGNFGFQIDHIQYGVARREANSVAPARQEPPAAMIRFRDLAGWHEAPGGLDTPASLQGLDSSGEGLSFFVDQLGGEMRWNAPLKEPLSTEQMSWATVRYRAAHLPRVNSGAVRLIGTDAFGAEVVANLISLTSAIDDANWHVAVAPVPRMKTSEVGVYLLGASPRSFLEVDSVRFHPFPPTISLADFLDVRDSWAAAAASFTPLDFPCNGRSADWLSQVGYADWFSGPKTTISGVPFRIGQDALDVLATPFDQPGRIIVPVGRKAEAIYLLLGARMTGNESPSISEGPRRKTSQPEHVCLSIEYDDGSVDRVFPEGYPHGQHVISNEPAVYVLHPRAGLSVRQIALDESLRRGQFVLIAASTGPRLPMREISVASLPASHKQPVSQSRSAAAQTVAGPDGTEIIFDEIAILQIRNQSDGTVWSSGDAPVFEHDGGTPIRTSLQARALPEGGIEFSLQLTNTGEQNVRVAPSFPVLRGVGAGMEAQLLEYCFPSRAGTIGSDPVIARSRYSGQFPLQFIDVHRQGSGGVFFMTRDTESSDREFWMEKTNAIDMGVRYTARTLAPGETWKLPSAVVAVHEGDWHEALAKYRRWLDGWLRPAAPRKAWFRDVFNFRVQFLTFEQPRRSGVFDATTKSWGFDSVLAQDKAAFGGIDYLHLFDWAWTPDRGRVGDYAPWEFLGGKEAFREQIRAIQEGGIPVGLYLEGYLVSRSSQIGSSSGAAWAMRDASGQMVSQWGSDYFTLCPYIPAWQSNLADSYRRVLADTDAQGIYIDQFGFGSQYRCFAADHGHAPGVGNLAGEAQFLRRLREAAGAERVLYTEEVSVDAHAGLRDGAYTYCITQGLKRGNALPVSMMRFAIPDFKTIELLSEEGAQEDYLGVKLAFFNGEGLYLAGVPTDWYSPEILALIRKTHAILREHRKAFASANPVPLVGTLASGVQANRFETDGEVAWTMFNSNYQTVRGDVLGVEHVPNSTYYDAWTSKTIEPRMKEGRAVLSVELGPRDTGCVVQRFPSKLTESSAR